MRLHRFIVSTPFQEGSVTLTDRDAIQQMIQVLRLKIGDQMVICDGAGREAKAQIESVDTRALELFVQKVEMPEREPKTRVILYASLLKRENIELVVQKATEAGVAEIVPITSARTVKLGFKRDRLEKIIKEASEQSGRAVLPVLHEPMSLESALVHAKQNDANLFYHVGLGSMSVASDRVGVFVGPEGGWSEEEVASAERAGCMIAGLGTLVLRAETAAIVATYLAAHP